MFESLRGGTTTRLEAEHLHARARENTVPEAVENSNPSSSEIFFLFGSAVISSQLAFRLLQGSLIAVQVGRIEG